MQSFSKLFSGLFSGILIALLFIGCASSPSEEADTVKAVEATEVEQVTQDNGLNSSPVFEEVLPDTGLMEGVNPEEIITDDWNSDSPDAEATDD